MNHPARSILLALAAFNLAALVAFAVLRFGHSPQIETDALRKYAELDGAGVINHDVLKQFPTFYGTDKHHDPNWVPERLIAPAASEERAIGMLGLILAGLSSSAIGVAWMFSRPTGRKRSASMPRTLDATADQKQLRWKAPLSQRARAILLALLPISILAVVGFAVARFILPIGTGLEARMRYTDLDRAGVINHEALQRFPGLVNAGNHTDRFLVPEHLVGPAVSAQRDNAMVGLILALLNSVATGVVLRVTRPARTPSPTLAPATTPPPIPAPPPATP